ncbi:MAG: response regulator [Verrucomicrobia bacterium]|nr:response regulator [Verrucomicrobiota bacterium]
MKAASKSRDRQPDKTEKGATREASAAVSATTTKPPARRRILLVDDDADVRGSLQDVLVEEGYVVIPANDGQQALELSASSSIDLVLLDLNMPRKNGWYTFERLSAEHPLVPVVLITARPNQLFTAVGAGVGALLEKPLDIPILLQTIARLLAESDETHLARLAGRDVPFRYAAGKTYSPAKRGNPHSPPT